ncbi:DUF2271 domain-containing protein [Oceanisphaera sp. W20_SRM_FM3]|uniref:DUF2271 domain-containing protein n=1 Tax=Oceanisphaera sp. W20_SRM_FM3 TaxID=3240267 RepID=UPI003F9E03A0
MNKPWLSVLMLTAMWTQVQAAPVSSPMLASKVDIELTLPKGNQHRPYVAVWVANAEQVPLKTLAVWQKESDWLKDLRLWWRKVGRYDQGELDGVTAATRRPGQYRLSWDGTDSQGKPVAAGDYQINIEAAREHGSRSLVQQSITLGGKDQTFTIKPSAELGEVIITLK